MFIDNYIRVCQNITPRDSCAGQVEMESYFTKKPLEVKAEQTPQADKVMQTYKLSHTIESHGRLCNPVQWQ